MTFYDIYTEIQSLTGDSSVASTTIHKRRTNETYRELLRKFNKRKTGTATTIASIQEYELPPDLNKITSAKLTVSDIDYPLTEVVNEDSWNILNAQGTDFTSDIQTHYYIRDNKILLYPTPASDGYTITYYYSRKDKDLSNDNYTTGSISDIPFTVDFTVAPAEDDVSATLASAWGLPTGVYQVVFDNGDVRNVTLTITKTTATWDTALTEDCSDVTVTVNNSVGGSIVTGSGTTFTAAMVGRFLKVTSDGYWYEIYSYLDATHITLSKEYAGTAISSGSEAYAIAEIPLLPEEYHRALVYYPCFQYFLSKRDGQMAALYKGLYEEIFRRIKPEEDISSSVIVSNEEIELRNPADFPRV
jgi:hypothetical protein